MGNLVGFVELGPIDGFGLAATLDPLPPLVLLGGRAEIVYLVVVSMVAQKSGEQGAEAQAILPVGIGEGS